MTAAEGIYRVINTHMAEGIRLVSVRRGVDPRRFAILSFGGAAALHVTDVRASSTSQRVIVPRLSAVLSAWGMLASNLRCEVARTHIGDASRLDAARCALHFGEMESEGRRRLAAASFDGPVRVARSADMRYGEQVFEVSVPLDHVDFEHRNFCGKWRTRSTPGTKTSTPTPQRPGGGLVNARVAAIGELPALPQEPSLPSRQPAKPRGHRRVYLKGWREVPIYEFTRSHPINGSMVQRLSNRPLQRCCCAPATGCEPPRLDGSTSKSIRPFHDNPRV